MSWVILTCIALLFSWKSLIIVIKTSAKYESLLLKRLSKMIEVRGDRSKIHAAIYQQNMNKFKSLEKTYKIVMTLMIFGMMYPNPKIDRIRQVAIPIISILCLPAIAIIAMDIYYRIQNDDMENMVRQMIIIICVMFVNIKFFLTIIHKKDLREIFESINRDYAAYNDLPEDYQNLVEESIRTSRVLERIWAMIIFSAAIVFPGSAVFLNVYFLFFTDTPKRFMVHECRIWFMSEEQMYSTPVYEIFFGYCLFIVTVIFVGFTAFDGMFSICMFHVSLKIKILSNKIIHLLDNSPNAARIKANIAEIVRDQHTVYTLIAKLMRCYEVWLAMIFVVSMAQTGMALAQTTSGKHSGAANLIFFLFMGSSVAHIYFPCYLSSDVTHTAALVADAIYSMPWEDVPEPGFRRTVAYMLARAQIPVNITPLKLLTFNMNMFMSVMQTAYSMFTLLRE